MNMASYVMIAAALVLLITLHVLNWTELQRGEQLTFYTALLLCVASLAPVLFPKTDGDHVERDRAKLRPTLVVTSVTNGTFDCDFVFENTGVLKASGITHAYRSPGMVGLMNCQAMNTYELAAGDIMEAYGGFFEPVPPDGEPTTIRLFLTYNTDIGGNKHTTASAYWFAVRQPIEPGTRIPFLRAIHREGMFSLEDLAALLGN